MNVIRTITPRELDQLRSSEGRIELIDVRTPVEYRGKHVTYAVNAPLDSLDPAAIMAARNGWSAAPLYVICHKGNHSRVACERFMGAGFENVVSVEGGTVAAAEQGLPLKHGKKAISLECQVRISAGFLVILGVVLGFYWGPYATLLSAFVGAGLMYAGFTDSCPMALWLAKMPWNRIRGSCGGQIEKGEAACCS
jgi:rhodanese-related sulfurtransferase